MMANNKMNEIPTRLEELRRERGEHRAVFRMSDGTHQAEEYALPRFVRNGETAAMEAVDNTLIAEEDGRRYRNRKNVFTARFSREATTDELFSLERDDHRVSVSLSGPTPVPQMHGNNILRFEKAVDGADLEYSVTDGGVKEIIWISSSAAARRYSFRLQCENVHPVCDSTARCITFVSDKTEEAVFHIPAPFMQDAAGEISEAVTYELAGGEDGVAWLTVIADGEWLCDPARVFPVALDPTITTLPSSVTTYTWSNNTLTQSGSSMLVGYDANGIEHRMFLQLTPPTLPQNALVQKVEMVFTQPSSPAVNCPPIGLFVTEGLTAENAVLLDYNGAQQGVYAPYAFDITKQVAQSLGDGGQPLTLMLKTLSVDATQSGTVRLFGHNSGYAPKFVVTYDPAYFASTASRAHTHDIGRFGQGQVDLFRGNLWWECEDFAWGGNRMPVTLKHRFNSTLCGKSYTAGSVEGMCVADFSAMKIGYGFSLNVMQSLCPAGDGSYHYVDDNGCNTVLSARTDDAGNVTHYADEDDLLRYDPAARELASGGETLAFDTAGRLIRITDGYGNVQSVNYEDGRITTVTDGAGRAFTFAYDTSNRLSSITAPDGTAVRYGYADDLLTLFFYPDGRRGEIHYTNDRPATVLLYKNIDHSELDCICRAKYLWSQNGCVTVVEEGAYTGPSYVWGSTTSFAYDPAARRTVVTTESVDETIHTAYAFDADGEVVSEYSYTLENGHIHPYADGTGGLADNVNWLENHAFKIENLSLVEMLTADTDWALLPQNDAMTSAGYYNRVPTAPHGKSTICIITLEAASGATQNGVYQTVNALPAGEYAFSAYMRAVETEAGGSVNAYLRVVDTAGNVLAESEKIGGDVEWMRLCAPFTLAADATVQVQMLVDGNGVAYANAPQLENNAYATAYNLLENASFERGTAEWTVNGGASVTATTATGFNGAHAVQLANQFDAVCEMYQDVAVKEEAGTRETFILAGWAKGYGFPQRDRNTEIQPGFGLRAEIVYADETIPAETFTADFSAVTEDWQFASVQFCKSHFAAVDHIRVSCDFGQNLGTACFDALKLVRCSLETDLKAEDFMLDEEDESTEDETNVTEDTPAFEEVYDAYGNPLTETIFTEGEDGTIYRAFGYRNGYDIAAREGNDRVSEVDPRGNVTRYMVDDVTSRNEEVTDRCGNKTAYTYDVAGRVTRVANVGADGAAYGAVDYTYDISENLTAITRGDGMAYTLGYNPFRNLESIGVAGKVEPLVQYTYKNGNGRLKSVTYANGDRMTATYNGLGQLTAETWHDAGEVLIARYKYAYDNSGNIVRSIDILAAREYTYIYEEGILTRAAEYSVTVGDNEMITNRTLLHSVHWVYDSAGALVRKTFAAADGTTHTVTFENEEQSSTVQFTVGETTVNCRSTTDHFGRKTQDGMYLGDVALTRTWAYHDGAVTEEHSASGKVPSAPTTQLVSRLTFANGRTIAYEYDAEERITKVIDSVDGTTEYTYDALGQLLTETVNGILVNRMSYDSYGNILSKNGAQYTYGDTNWRDLLTAYNGHPITYDAQGNPTNYLGHTLTWEKGRQLKSFDNIQYTYNANGIRTSKTVGGIRHTYTLNGTKILRETWCENTLIPLYDNEDSVCGVLYDGCAFYFQKNLQGDVIAITNYAGDLVARYTYDAWGVCTVASDTSGVNIAAVNPFRYRGYYYDAEIGMYYLQSRYYDPAIGRFVNGDMPELSFWGYGDLFAYCENIPTVLSDPTGYQPKWAQVISRCYKRSPAYSIFLKITQNGYYSNLFWVAGFFRTSDGVYHTRQDCWQQFFGYNDFYDWAFDLGTKMRREKFPFKLDGKDYIFWGWKGDYLNLGAGAELGIYSKLTKNGKSIGHWRAETKSALPMTMKLKYCGRVIANYRPNIKQWWITSFNPFFQDVDPKYLEATFTVNFSTNQKMFKAFYRIYGIGARKSTLWRFDTKNYRATFTF